MLRIRKNALKVEIRVTIIVLVIWKQNLKIYELKKKALKDFKQDEKIGMQDVKDDFVKEKFIDGIAEKIVEGWNHCQYYRCRYKNVHVNG